jgi:methyl-accepting chemotaxis protein
MTKVALAPALVLLCLLVVSGFGYWTSQTTTRTLDFLTQKSFVNVTLVAEVQERAVAANAMVMQSMAFAGAGLKPAVIKALDEKIGVELKATQQRLDHLREVLAADPESAAKLALLEPAFKKYSKAALDTLDMKDADLSTAAIMMSTAETAYGETRSLLGDLFQHEVKQAERSGEQASASMATSNLAAGVISAVALLLGVLLTWAIARQIVLPLQAAVGIARDVADGNLRLREVHAGSDETGQVLRALGEVTQRLNGMIGDIRKGAEQIDTAASEISNGNNDLASRTEQTASALQATSSSVADLANTIKLNAETSSRASLLATESSRVAQQGGTDVAAVVQTMEAISVQAKRIGEIIATIDGIAFQTNILALNAAVEAARAGEQGRGFAVVASEVRSLAQRSSEAAKEIRVLIAASAEQVSSGTLKVHAAGETMRRIVTSIEQVSTMVAEISRATTEQANAIHGVNEAVSDMDRSTQQNAALVEESAAAAESLRSQAAGLVQTISVFHVAQSASHREGNYQMRRLS